MCGYNRCHGNAVKGFWALWDNISQNIIITLRIAYAFKLCAMYKDIVSKSDELTKLTEDKYESIYRRRGVYYGSKGLDLVVFHYYWHKFDVTSSQSIQMPSYPKLQTGIIITCWLAVPVAHLGAMIDECLWSDDRQETQPKYLKKIHVPSPLSQPHMCHGISWDWI
jgi:hypothetical protein